VVDVLPFCSVLFYSSLLFTSAFFCPALQMVCQLSRDVRDDAFVSLDMDL
jgi:hypothetical protein